MAAAGDPGDALAGWFEKVRGGSKNHLYFLSSLCALPLPWVVMLCVVDLTQWRLGLGFCRRDLTCLCEAFGQTHTACLHAAGAPVKHHPAAADVHAWVCAYVLALGALPPSCLHLSAASLLLHACTYPAHLCLACLHCLHLFACCCLQWKLSIISFIHYKWWW